MPKTAMQPQSLLCDSLIEHKRSKWGRGALENHQSLSTSLFNPAKNLVHPAETLPSSTHTLYLQQQQQRAVGSFKATPESCRSLGASLRDTIRHFPHAFYCGATCRGTSSPRTTDTRVKGARTCHRSFLAADVNTRPSVRRR